MRAYAPARTRKETPTPATSRAERFALIRTLKNTLNYAILATILATFVYALFFTRIVRISPLITRFSVYPTPSALEYASIYAPKTPSAINARYTAYRIKYKRFTS